MRLDYGVHAGGFGVGWEACVYEGIELGVGGYVGRCEREAF